MRKQAFLSTHRAYREALASQDGEVSFQVVLEHTDLFVTARSDLSGPMLDYVRELRGELKTHMLLNPGFRESLVPFPTPDSAPLVARMMAQATQAVGVGPFAAVAGTFAHLVAERFAGVSPDLIVENGGDITMHSTRERIVALLADPGDPEHGARLGLRIPRGEFPVSLCGSSATIGPSLSLGQGELVVVRSRSGALADAAATALANLIDGADDLDLVTRRAKEMAPLGVEGVFAQAGGRLAVWGKMELVALD